MTGRIKITGPADRLIVSGAALALVGGATHGDLPEGSGASALQFVADHPAYALVHFVSILGAAGWVAGVTLRARDQGHWAATGGAVAATIGAAVLAVQFSLDGVGLEALARLWSTSPADRAMVETIAEVAPDVFIGLALTWVMVLYGLAPALLGWALLGQGRRTLGLTGTVLGVFTLAGALALALGAAFIPDAVVFGGATIGANLWLVATTVQRA